MENEKIDELLMPYKEQIEQSGLSMETAKNIYLKLFTEGSYVKPLADEGGIENEATRNIALDLFVTLKLQTALDNPNSTYSALVFSKQIYEQTNFKQDEKGNAILDENEKMIPLSYFDKMDAWGVTPENGVVKTTAKGEILKTANDILKVGKCFDITSPTWSADDSNYTGLWLSEERGSTMKEIETFKANIAKALRNTFREVMIPDIVYPSKDDDNEMEWRSVRVGKTLEIIIIDGMLRSSGSNTDKKGKSYYYGRVGVNHLSPDQLKQKDLKKELSATFLTDDILNYVPGSKGIFLCTLDINQYQKKDGEMVSEPQMRVKAYHIYFRPEKVAVVDTSKETSAEETKKYIEDKKQELAQKGKPEEVEVVEDELCDTMGDMSLDHGCKVCLQNEPEQWDVCAEETGIEDVEKMKVDLLALPDE